MHPDRRAYASENFLYPRKLRGIELYRFCIVLQMIRRTRARPAAPEDGTGVDSENRTGESVKFVDLRRLSIMRTCKYVLIGILVLMVWGGLSLIPSSAQNPGEFKALVTLLEETRNIRRTLEKNQLEIRNNFKALLQPTWEYLVVVPNRLVRDGNKGEYSLESLGKNGWELVIFNVETGYIFKRRIMGNGNPPSSK